MHLRDASAQKDILVVTAKVRKLFADKYFNFSSSFKDVSTSNQSDPKPLNTTNHYVASVATCENDSDCMNGGTCTPSSPDGPHYCENCYPGYTGSLCDCMYLK